MLESNLAEGTTLGQIVLFITFLVNMGVQLWREHKASKATELQRQEAIRVAEATKQELIIRDEENKRKLAEQTAQLKGDLRERMEKMSKRFDDLLPRK